MKFDGEIIIQAPANRYYSVIGLLLDTRSHLLNGDELRLTDVFGEHPVRLRCLTADLETIERQLELLSQEFSQKFEIVGADF